MAYEALSGWYDAFTDDVPYAEWADRLCTLLPACGCPPKQGKLVLDLACGTGTLTCLLAGRGYEMIGADASAEMLEVAGRKALELPDGAERPVFLCQRAEKLDLYGTIDACICCLDSVNYLTDRAVLAEAFRRVSLFMNPGGVFLFDFNTPFHFRDISGKSYVRETEDAYCVYTAEYTESTRLCCHYVDLFVLMRPGVYSRAQEIHRERAYTLRILKPLLTAAGFTDIRCTSALTGGEPAPDEKRVVVTARKPGSR